MASALTTEFHRRIARAFVDRIVPFVIAGTIGLLGVWGRAIPVDVLDSSITPSVKPGQNFVVSREMKWRRWDCVDVEMSAVLIDSQTFHHALQAKDIGTPNYYINSSHEWPVPFTMPWGRTIYQGRLSFECFPFYRLWPVTVVLPELTFDVIPTLER